MTFFSVIFLFCILCASYCFECECDTEKIYNFGCRPCVKKEILHYMHRCGHFKRLKIDCMYMYVCVYVYV